MARVRFGDCDPFETFECGRGTEHELGCQVGKLVAQLALGDHDGRYVTLWHVNFGPVETVAPAGRFVADGVQVGGDGARRARVGAEAL